MMRSIVLPFVAAVALIAGTAVQAAPAAPAEIKIGELYASSGPYAAISMPVYSAFKLWVSQQNAAGGVYVGPFHKKIPIKLISYDDQSSTATAASLYNQLITVDKVNLLLADLGSVLTSVAVPIAKEHKQFLFDISGSGAVFFTKDNPYIALIGLAETAVMPKYLSDFLNKEGPDSGLKRVAIIYSTNDYTGGLATALSSLIKSDGKVEIVYNQGVPTSTSNYTVLINNIAATRPDAVIEFGYVGNDIAFLRGLQDLGVKFPFVFTIYTAGETATVKQAVGLAGMTNVFSFVSGANYHYKTTFGPNVDGLHAMWDKAYPPGSGVDWGVNAIYGYGTGVVVERTLATTKSLSQLDLRDAVFGLSGKMTTLSGPFELNAEGAQIGELQPLGQLQPDGKGGFKIVVVYPPNLANGKPMFVKKTARGWGRPVMPTKVGIHVFLPNLRPHCSLEVERSHGCRPSPA